MHVTVELRDVVTRKLLEILDDTEQQLASLHLSTSKVALDRRKEELIRVLRTRGALRSAK